MNYKQARDLYTAQKLKIILFDKMMNEFGSLIHNSDDKQKIHLLFNIPGKEDTYHVFQFPQDVNQYLTKEGAHKILNELKQFDEKLSTFAELIWFSKPE